MLRMDVRRTRLRAIPLAMTIKKITCMPLSMSMGLHSCGLRPQRSSAINWFQQFLCARSSYNSSGCRNFPQVETKRKQIIVKFANHKIKSNIYKSRAKLKNIKVSNLFPSATAATRVAGDRIFLCENLTSYRKKIVNRANEMRRDGLLLSVWTLDGKIYVKTSPEGRPIKINDLEDLENV